MIVLKDEEPMKLYEIIMLLALVGCTTTSNEERGTIVFNKYSADEDKTPVYDDFKSNYSGKIIKELCGDVLDKKCQERLDQTFYARLKSYYKFMKVEHVILFCKANPLNCRTDEALERVTAKNHNANLKGEIKAGVTELNAINSEREWQAWQNYLNRSKTCNSIPNGTGGFSTQCY